MNWSRQQRLPWCVVLGGTRTVVLVAVTLAAVALQVAADGEGRSGCGHLPRPAAAPGRSEAVAAPVRRRDLVGSRVGRCLGLGGPAKASRGRSVRSAARHGVAIDKNAASWDQNGLVEVRQRRRGAGCASLKRSRLDPGRVSRTTGLARPPSRTSTRRSRAQRDDQVAGHAARPAREPGRPSRTVHGYGAGYYEFAWQLVEVSNQAVPLQSHQGVMVFGGSGTRRVARAVSAGAARPALGWRSRRPASDSGGSSVRVPFELDA